MHGGCDAEHSKRTAWAQRDRVALTPTQHGAPVGRRIGWGARIVVQTDVQRTSDRPGGVGALGRRCAAAGSWRGASIARMDVMVAHLRSSVPPRHEVVGSVRRHAELLGRPARSLKRDRLDRCWLVVTVAERTFDFISGDHLKISPLGVRVPVCSAGRLQEPASQRQDVNAMTQAIDTAVRPGASFTAAVVLVMR